MYFEYPGNITNIGSQLKNRRKQLKMTQCQLAKFAGCSPQQIQKYETGASRMPLPVFLNLCNILKTHPNFFFRTLRLAEDTEFSTNEDLEQMLLTAFRSVTNNNIKERIVNLVEALVASSSEQESE